MAQAQLVPLLEDSRFKRFHSFLSDRSDLCGDFSKGLCWDEKGLLTDVVPIKERIIETHHLFDQAAAYCSLGFDLIDAIPKPLPPELQNLFGIADGWDPVAQAVICATISQEEKTKILDNLVCIYNIPKLYSIGIKTHAMRIQRAKESLMVVLEGDSISQEEVLTVMSCIQDYVMNVISYCICLAKVNMGTKVEVGNLKRKAGPEHQWQLKEPDMVNPKVLKEANLAAETSSAVRKLDFPDQIIELEEEYQTVFEKFPQLKDMKRRFEAIVKNRSARTVEIDLKKMPQITDIEKACPIRPYYPKKLQNGKLMDQMVERMDPTRWTKVWSEHCISRTMSDWKFNRKFVDKMAKIAKDNDSKPLKDMASEFRSSLKLLQTDNMRITIRDDKHYHQLVFTDEPFTDTKEYRDTCGMAYIIRKTFTSKEPFIYLLYMLVGKGHVYMGTTNGLMRELINDIMQLKIHKSFLLKNPIWSTEIDTEEPVSDGTDYSTMVTHGSVEDGPDDTIEGLDPDMWNSCELTL